VCGNRQLEIRRWQISMFGSDDPKACASHFIEEAIEVVQSAGLSIEEVLRIADRVYLGPSGYIHQELGQAALTLEAMAESLSVNLTREADEEFARIKSYPADYWRSRQEAKRSKQVV
jgi:hypothetical protein